MGVVAIFKTNNGILRTQGRDQYMNNWGGVVNMSLELGLDSAVVTSFGLVFSRSSVARADSLEPVVS